MDSQAGNCVPVAATKTRNLSGLFQIFLCLQAVDVITTLLVLRIGGQELNPVLRGFMQLGPMTGLLAGKMTVLTIGAFVVWCRRARVLVIANRFYMALAVWNIATLIAIQTHIGA